MSRRYKISYLSISIIILIFFVINGATYINNALVPDDTDTTAYLSEAYNIKEIGGVTHFIQNCFNGNYTYANRHPFYLLLLSLDARRDIRFFIFAKWISFIFGFLTVLLFFCIAWRLFNLPVASFSLLLITLNVQFLQKTTMVGAESCLALFTLLSWAFTMKDIKQGKYFFPAGLAAGMAFLSKGNGLFLLFVFVGTVLIFQKWHTFKNRYFWLYFIGFLLVSFPLLVRNQVVYHNPVYNDNSRVMWLDSWRDVRSLSYIQGPKNEPNIRTYFRDHTFLEFTKRFIRGFKRQFYSLGMLTKLIVFPSMKIVIFILTLIFFGVACFHESRARMLFSLLLIGIFFVFFAWYSDIVWSTRFMIPVLPVLLVYASFGLWESIKKFNLNSHLIVLSLIALLFIPSSYQTIRHRRLKHPSPESLLPSGYYPLMNWIHRNTADSKIIFGSTHAFPLFYYDKPVNRGNIFVMPLFKKFKELLKYTEDTDIRYIIMDYELFRQMRELFKSYLFYLPREGFQIKKIPDSLTVVFRDPSDISNYVIYKVSATPQAACLLQAGTNVEGK